MTLSPGQSLAHYSILGPLGAGAMGEVWRARDTRLEREVAIKVLPEEFAGDEERLRRFEREAKALATLNHPNVAQIHGVDQIGDTCFLVLELVPGETSEGGSCPVWSRDGRELFYVDGNTIRAVLVSTQPSFSGGPPRTVAELDFLPSSESLVNYDVAPDGRLLLVRSTSQSSFESHVNVVLGWGAGLRRTGDK